MQTGRVYEAGLWQEKVLPDARARKEARKREFERARVEAREREIAVYEAEGLSRELAGLVYRCKREGDALDVTTSGPPLTVADLYPDLAAYLPASTPDRTRTLLERHNPRDAEGWDHLYGQFRTFRRTLLSLLGTPLPSLAAAVALARAVRRAGVGELLGAGQIVASSTRELADTYFASPEARALVAAWGMHVDFGPDEPRNWFWLVEYRSWMKPGSVSSPRRTAPPIVALRSSTNFVQPARAR